MSFFKEKSEILLSCREVSLFYSSIVISIDSHTISNIESLFNFFFLSLYSCAFFKKREISFIRKERDEINSKIKFFMLMMMMKSDKVAGKELSKSS